MRAIGMVLRLRGLRLLLGAGLVSLTGDWILRIGLAYYIYVLTGSTLASATMLLASFVPQVALSSLAGVFVDRWDAKRTMIVTNLLLAAGLLPLLAVHRASEVWIIYVVVAYEACVQQFFAPAQQSVMPRLVDEQHLVTANALNGQATDISRLAGSAAGGVLAAAGGIAAVTVADLASFLAAALLIAWLPALRPATIPPGPVAPDASPAEGTPAGPAGPAVRTELTGAGDAEDHADRAVRVTVRARLAQLRSEWADGLQMSVRQPVLRVVLIFLAVTSIGEGIMGTLFAPFVRSVLHGSGPDYGVIVAAQAIGGIGGGLIAAAVGHRFRPAWLFGAGAVAFGTVDLALFLYPLAHVAVWPAIVLMIVVGVPGALLLAGAMTLLQSAAADSHRGRVFGALGAVEGVAVVAGTIAAGFLGQSVGIIPVLAAQGGGYVAGGIAVLIALRAQRAASPAGPASPAEPADLAAPPDARAAARAADADSADADSADADAGATAADVGAAPAGGR
ncbi:MAG TPA: MFS transporter [Streptosporangiaceae bacterium]